MKTTPDSQPELWTVDFTAKARKQAGKLPPVMAERLFILALELRNEGPEQPEWRNYGKLVNKKDVYHCHLNSGKPRYVAVWKVTDRQVKIMEILYAGSHENADYRLIG